MTAGAFFRRRDHRRGRAPWPGPHPGPAGRARGLHATGARAGPAAGGNGSSALCLISLISRPIQGWPMAASPARLAGSSGNRTDPGAVARRPKVAAGWSFARRRSITRRCYRPGGGTVSGNQAQLPGPATASARLAARRAAIPTALQPPRRRLHPPSQYSPVPASQPRPELGALSLPSNACTNLARQLNAMRRAGTWVARTSRKIFPEWHLQVTPSPRGRP